MPETIPGRRADAAEARNHVLALRRAGMTFQEIGNARGVTTARAWQIYQAAIRQIPQLDSTEHRHEEIAITDEISDGLRKIFYNEKVSPRTRVEAANALRAWRDHGCRIAGTYAPGKRPVVWAGETDVDARIAQLCDEMAREGAPPPAPLPGGSAPLAVTARYGLPAPGGDDDGQDDDGDDDD